MALRKKWEVQPQAPRDYLVRFPNPILAQCLYNRGLRSFEEAQAFVDGHLESGDPLHLMDMHQAVARIRQAIKSGERMAIYGDFDADGVAATALLVQTLLRLGGNVSPYIPRRLEEGYGLNVHALDSLEKEGCTLIITVDCGIRSLEEARHARRRGLDLIITDHHSPPEDLPPALAVINPKRPDCPYPFKELAGVGVAYKLAQALLKVEKRVPIKGKGSTLEEESLLDLVALGTVTDLSPLVGENRALVKRGLEVLNCALRPGIRALLDMTSLDKVNAEAIGYILGPRLNASGRLGDAMESYRLLLTDSPEEARELAVQLDGRNQERQRLMLATLEKSLEQVAGHESEPLLLAKGEDFPAGVVGLVAGRLTEAFYRPSVVIEIGKEESRGSARSIPEFHITRALEECQDLLTRFGGHSQAAGFTVKNDLLPSLEDRLSKIAARQLAGLTLIPVLPIDAETPLGTLEPSMFTYLQELAPFGPGNPPPALLSRQVEVREGRLVGEGHLKLLLTDGRAVWDAIAFQQLALRLTADGMGTIDLPGFIDVVYTPEINRWAQEDRLQLKVLDFRPASEET